MYIDKNIHNFKLSNSISISVSIIVSALISLSIIFFAFIPVTLKAQTNSDVQTNKSVFTVDGYISVMGMGMYLDDMSYDYSIYNRLNFEYSYGSNLFINIGMRNLVLPNFGMSNNSNFFSRGVNFLPLTMNWHYGDRRDIKSIFDRFNIQYFIGNWEFCIGRQNINWSRSLVWNPCNIMSTFSYYDIDYPEKQGFDAVSVKYYLGDLSSIQAIAKIDSVNHVSVAAMFKTNLSSVDLQVITAYENLSGINPLNNRNAVLGGARGFNESEAIVLGAGWEANIGPIGFRGEIVEHLVLNDNNNIQNDNNKNALLCSLSLDYMIDSKWSVQAEYLYNDSDYVINLNLYGYSSLYSAPSDPRSLSFSENNIFTRINYIASPIVNLSLAGIYYPDINTYFLMPNIKISLLENLDLSMISQIFYMDSNHIPSTYIVNSFFQLKYSF
ncbi:MAG: hypothetical protein WC140_06295 [Bacteroidales bacterium]